MRTLALIAAMAVAFSAQADTVQVREDAPDRHVVVKGDTLWDISAKFLKSPWKWPQVWKMNKGAIKNPHRIYPGDIIYLSYVDGKPVLGRIETVKLSPRIHEEVIPRQDGIPAIPPQAVAPFISRAGIFNKEDLQTLPRIVAAKDERVMYSLLDTVYATASGDEVPYWYIIRPGKELVDPDTQEVLGLEAIHVGEAQTLRHGSPQTLLITKSVMEVTVGDKLMRVAPDNLSEMVPRAPEKQIEGKIISAYGGVNTTGHYANVVINRGARDGLEPGHVLAVYRLGREIKDQGEPVKYQRTWRYMDTKCLKPGKTITYDEFYNPKEVFEDCKKDDALVPMLAEKEAWRFMDIGCLKPGAKISATEFFNPREVYREHCRPEDEKIQLPDNRIGTLFIYRVFDKVAYALVMSSDGPIYLLDAVRNP